MFVINNLHEFLNVICVTYLAHACAGNYCVIAWAANMLNDENDIHYSSIC